MAKEAEIRKKAVQELTSRGWLTWYPSKARFRQNDVFGVIDLLALKGKNEIYSVNHLNKFCPPEEKILNFFKKEGVRLKIEIWAYNKRQKEI